MSFSDRSEGDLAPSGDIHFFGSCLPENERDSMLAEKIEGELAVVIRVICLQRFADQDEARRLLSMSSRNQKKHSR